MKLMKAVGIVLIVYLAYLIGWVVALVVGLSLSVLIIRAILVSAKEAEKYGYTDTPERPNQFVGGEHLFEDDSRGTS